MSLEGFFEQTTFYHNMGDWPSFQELHKQLGEAVEIDAYVALRKDARVEAVRN